METQIQEKPKDTLQPEAPPLTPMILKEQREKLITALEKTRLLPEDHISGKGKTKAELLEALQNAMKGVNDKLDEMPKEVDKSDIEQGAATRAEKKMDEAVHYLTVKSAIGITKIPICPPPASVSKWEAVPGEMFVEGGKKWSKVAFEKKSGTGFSETLRPGDEVSFGQTKGERLEVIDNILEGRGELQAFNETLKTLAELKNQYVELNPDADDYNEKAIEIAGKIELIRTGKANEVVDFSKLKISDPAEYSERIGEIIQTQEYLQEVDEGSNEFVPPIDSHFKLTPFYTEKFAWFAELVNRQLGLGNNSLMEKLSESNELPEWEKLSAKGMTVMVGPRGAGKNKLAEHYCSATERPLYRYSCSPDKEERDLTYDVVLQDGEVVKIPSRIITAISTPNSMLELDEVNLLRPAVSKFFNSLLDGDRALFLNDKVIKVAPGVVIVGLMNPADYEGVENLPETIDDRSNVMSFDYPPFRKRDSLTNAEIFTHDEALILKENISALALFDDESFVKIWDGLFNGKPLDGFVDPEIVTIIKDLKNIISIANRTRETVRAYKTRTGETRMERDLSLRGLIEAAKFYSEKQLWKVDLNKMPDHKTGWNASQYAVAATYLPHVRTYRRGDSDAQALELILAEQVR